MKKYVPIEDTPGMNKLTVIPDIDKFDQGGPRVSGYILGSEEGFLERMEKRIKPKAYEIAARHNYRLG